MAVLHRFTVQSNLCKMATLKNIKTGFQDKLSLYAGQKYCRMLEHSAILSTFIKLPIVIKIFVLSIFEWPFNTCFTVSLSRGLEKSIFNVSLDQMLASSFLTTLHK